MPRAPFITIEGLDGVGKSTIHDMLCKQLHAEGVDVFRTAEPYSSSISDLIKYAVTLNPEAETLLFLADRSKHVHEALIPSLEAGRLVLCDRYHDSTIAYQCYGKGVDSILARAILDTYCCGLKPDLTLWLDAPIEVTQARLSERDSKSDRFESEPLEFWERLREGFAALHKQEPRRIIRIDAEKSMYEVGQECLDLIHETITLKSS